MTPYLVQRAKFLNREWKEGIDSIIKLDYMGSTEFELDSVPKSLDRIRENSDEYIYLSVDLNDKKIKVYCKKNQREDINEYLSGIAQRMVRLKEYSDFDTYVFPKEGIFSSKNRTDFWWDIKNDIMFWKDTPEFESSFKKSIKK